MESSKKGQRKRKSAGIGDIFEVNDKDLSPEPEETPSDEPEAKVLKTRNSDVSESRRNGEEHNPKTEDHVKIVSDLSDKPNELNRNDVVNDNVQDCDINSENVSNDLNLSEMPPNSNEDALEEGEVNDTITIDESVLSPIGQRPSITIKFDDKFIADVYKSKCLTFFSTFIELEVQNLDDTTINIFRNASISSKECIVVEDSPHKSAVKSLDDNLKFEEELAKELPSTPKNESPKKKKKKKKQKELFVLDTNPGEVNQKSIATKYSTKFLINNENQEDSKEVNRISAVNCFNCGQNHSLKDCSQALNYGKINSNRQKYMQKSKTTRYHLEEEQKYSHLQPGKISPALRKALGLKKHQMPSYIYQMRRLGYPPGWLEEAKVVESELAMFDIDGNNVKNTNSKKIKGLDPEKIINYPGFNVPLENDFKDEYKFHRVPPYSEDFCKEKMIDFFEKQCLQDEDDLEARDMDLDYTDDLIVIDTTEECVDVKTIQNKTLDSIIVSDSNTVPSPSLNDLEEEKDTLLAELKKREEIIPWDYTSEDTVPPSNGDEKVSAEKNKKKQVEGSKDSKKAHEKKESTKSDAEVATDNNSCEVVQNTTEIKAGESSDSRDTSSPLTVNNGANSVKHTSYGTPIIKSSTPYVRLPNPDNFSVGVSPVIDFENLPNSTGKYEQMTGILQKVRETLKKNQTKTKT